MRRSHTPRALSRPLGTLRELRGAALAARGCEQDQCREEQPRHPASGSIPVRMAARSLDGRTKGVYLLCSGSLSLLVAPPASRLVWIACAVRVMRVMRAATNNEKCVDSAANNTAWSLVASSWFPGITPGLLCAVAGGL